MNEFGSKYSLFLIFWWRSGLSLFDKAVFRILELVVVECFPVHRQSPVSSWSNLTRCFRILPKNLVQFFFAFDWWNNELAYTGHSYILLRLYTNVWVYKDKYFWWHIWVYEDIPPVRTLRHNQVVCCRMVSSTENLSMVGEVLFPPIS